MDGLIDILGKFDNNEAANRERQLALERTERKKLKAKKKAEEEARQAKLAAQRKEEMDARRAHEEAMQESKNKERELELKIAKYKEKERLAAEKAAADKQKRLEACSVQQKKRRNESLNGIGLNTLIFPKSRSCTGSRIMLKSGFAQNLNCPSTHLDSAKPQLMGYCCCL